MEKKKKRNLINAFGNCVSDFTKNSSIHGFQYLAPSRDRTLLERCLWWAVDLVVLYFAIYLILFSLNQLMEEPTFTTMENPNYPIDKIPFPGISVCNINKLSRKKVEAYVEEMMLKANISKTKMLNIVNLFGKLYDHGSVPEDEILVEYQSILETYDAHNKTGRFNPRSRLKRLAPTCEELISHCSWGNVEYNCSYLFVFEATMEGFCCIFNYMPAIRFYNTSNISPILLNNRNQKLYPSGPGLSAGLAVRVHSHKDDYYYPLISSIGANIHVFLSEDFPDTQSGSLHERLVSLGVQMFVRLYATMIYAVPEVKKYPIHKRHCKFREEAETLFGISYSFSDCILDCRLQSMMALCQCIPFNFVKAVYGLSLPQCTLIDIPCMHRYKEKWRRLYPENYKGDELNADKQDSLSCPDCVPTCSNTLYTVRNDFAFLNTYSKTQNYSIVNIFFEPGQTMLYKHDVVFYWYEIVSSLGGICGLMVGISLISVVEVIYFFTIKLLQHYFLD